LVEVDPEARVVVFAAVGKAWCAGMDLKLSYRDPVDKRIKRPPPKALAAAVYVSEANHRDSPNPILPDSAVIIEDSVGSVEGRKAAARKSRRR
jgi:enoyl-CoA hydratase/carnithine racemase